MSGTNATPGGLAIPFGLVDHVKYQEARDWASAAVAPVKFHAPTPLSRPPGGGAAGGGAAGGLGGGVGAGGFGVLLGTGLDGGADAVVAGRAGAASGTTGVG